MRLSHLVWGLAAALCLGCERAPKPPPAADSITLAGFTTIREVYGTQLIPAFKQRWRASSGRDVTFQESYVGSAAQSRAIIAGFEADVAALSLEPDVTRLAEQGLIAHDWKERANGIVSRSVVVIAVRPGNPKNIRDWSDLTRPGLSVLTPDPRTSGGAMWNIAAIYGSALRSGKDARALLNGVMANVSMMDKGARESMITFETGVGDAAISYENEVLTAQRAGKTIEYVIPPSTILIENPAAVVDKVARRHGSLEVAQAFVQFLGSEDAQAIFATAGMRPDAGAAVDVFTIADLGGWPAVVEKLFAKKALFEQAVSAGRGQP